MARHMYDSFPSEQLNIGIGTRRRMQNISPSTVPSIPLDIMNLLLLFFANLNAIAEDGPELVETNVGPGVILHQLPFSAEGIGVKSSLEKYL